jgi:hypothetical protein
MICSWCACMQAHPKVQELMYPMLRDDFEVVETYQVGRRACSSRTGRLHNTQCVYQAGHGPYMHAMAVEFCGHIPPV